MASKRDLTKQSFRLACCGTYECNFNPVQAGLSLTPKDVKSLTERGIAVSTQNHISFDNVRSTGDTYDYLFKRGYDLNTAWETTYNYKKGLLNVLKQAKRHG